MHYSLYCDALHIIYVDLGLLVGLLVVIVHLCLLYIGRRYSHFSHHSILSCLVYSVHCVRRFLPRRGLIFISAIHFLGMDYSLIDYFCSFYAIFGTLLHNIWYQSSFLGTRFCKTSHLGTFATILFLQGFRDRGWKPTSKTCQNISNMQFRSWSITVS